VIVKLRARARADLREIAAYSAEQHGEAVAAAYLRAIDAVLERLGDYPELGEAYGERPGVRRHPVGQHRVYYRRDAEKLSVLRVLHKARDVARHL
jgi:toxin ParE1/3/4